MSSVNDRVVVEFVRSLGSPSSSGDAGTSNPTDKASRKRILARINADEARLLAEGRPWYEVKASLQESDKAIIRDLSGLDESLLFLRRNIREGIAWYCDMSWSEKPTRKAPPLPAQEYDPTPFLKAVSTKCFNAQDLVREDLLCHFGFSRKGVVVEEDLADRIMKSYLLEAYKKQESEVSRGSNSPTKEHANPSPEEPANPPPTERKKEKRRKSSSGSDKHSKKKKTSPSVEVDKEAGASQPEQSSLEVSSFIARMITSTTVAFFQNFVPELDLPVVSSDSDKAITEALASNFLQHDNLMNEIEEVRGASDAEKKSLANKLAASEASVTRLQEEIKKVGEEAEEKIKKHRKKQGILGEKERRFPEVG
ncbi:beta-galactosidase 12-like [Dorcoceras hygrometricum]|uniref:Beta-galactosidase 12-like n=1 Tax=Dorcoceras hygrometricum TaxID=472368 RepID=A0A2Z7C638_9LAMI|nr:beta-galactosidase 12-like [Dorcoceras hygrometricum]